MVDTGLLTLSLQFPLASLLFGLTVADFLFELGLALDSARVCVHRALKDAVLAKDDDGNGDITQRYMHLSPAALDAAIRLLERRGNNEAMAGEPRPVEKKL